MTFLKRLRKSGLVVHTGLGRIGLADSPSMDDTYYLVRIDNGAPFGVSNGFTKRRYLPLAAGRYAVEITQMLLDDDYQGQTQIGCVHAVIDVPEQGWRHCHCRGIRWGRAVAIKNPLDSIHVA